MVAVNLKGVHKVTTKIKGKTYTYYYAWRGAGAPRLQGKPGSTEFINSFNEAIAELKTPDTDRFRSLVALYRSSNDYKELADSTKRNWGPWLDKIADYFGFMRIGAFDKTEKIRPRIRQWRGQWANQPRTADYGIQVLSRVCSYGVDPLGKLASNPCDGIKHLYKGDRSEIIWTDPDISQLKAAASKEIGWAVDLAALTGLRQGDLLNLPWSRVGEDAIVMPTSKGKKQNRIAYIPIYGELRILLASIPKRGIFVLTNSRGKQWTANGFGTSFDDAKKDAQMKEMDLHFHDLRGTAATKFYTNGIPIRVIAEILAWDEESVEKIIKRYVNRAAATKALIEQINEARTKAVKTGVKIPEASNKKDT